jgi:transposase
MPDFGAFVGIDVGKAELVVHILPARQDARFANTPAGIARLIGQLGGLAGPVAVVFEATGGYEHALWRTLAASGGAGIVARQLCPRRVRHFARARGRLHKTDRADAVTLAEYAAHFPGEGRSWPGPVVATLSVLVLRRRALVEARKGVMVRQARCELAVLKRLDRTLERLYDRQIAAVEAMVAQAIARDALLAAKAALLRSVPGIGPVLTACLLARMPELGEVAAGEAASMAGVAPMAQDSGEHRGKRKIAGGRREVRTVLFQAALCAERHNPEIAASAARLRARGKPHKQVVIASARKLLLLANAVLKRGTPWQPA